MCSRNPSQQVQGSSIPLAQAYNSEPRSLNPILGFRVIRSGLYRDCSATNGGFPKLGVLFGGPYITDHSICGVYFGVRVLRVTTKHTFAEISIAT